MFLTTMGEEDALHGRPNQKSDIGKEAGEDDRCHRMVDDLRMHSEGTEGRRRGLFNELSAHLVFVVVALFFGVSFSIGMNLTGLNAPASVILQFYNATYASAQNATIGADHLRMLWSLTQGAFTAGGIPGSLLVGVAGGQLGRKGAVFICCCLGVVSAALMGLSKMAASYVMMIIGRFFAGMSAGLGCGVVPMYLSEVAPGVSWRGALAGTFQLGVVCGMAAAVLAGQSYALGTPQHWQLILGLTGVLHLFLMLCVPLMPESPKFLYVDRKRKREAHIALVILRGEIDVQEELNLLRIEESQNRSLSKMRAWDLFKIPSLRTPMFLCALVQVAFHFSGVNSILFYSTLIMTEKLGEETAQQMTLALCLVQMFTCLACVVLVDRFGRRPLLLGGQAVAAAVTALLTVAIILQKTEGWAAWAIPVLLIAFIFFFSIGPGTITWFLSSELFPVAARSNATTISVLVNWVSNTIVVFGFLHVKAVLEEFSFLIFTASLALAFAVLFAKLPETNRKSAEEIQAFFQRQ